ncbi:hypothetical protein ANO11243_096370 [Dothideomycetidae sp. 11243]|nr:hypothetical protein ANO11243_096370 [fungal sp. No.11243]
MTDDQTMPAMAPLRKGDLIAFVSPSARLNDLFAHRVARGVEYFEKAGYRVKVIYKSQLSSDHETQIQERCAELHEAFGDPEVKAIVCTIGGTSANELLERLDYDLIRRNPKIFCGFSDITLLHHAFYTQAGLRSFYGPAVLTSWGEHPGPLEFTAQSFFAMTSGAGCSDDGGVLPQSAAWSQEWLDWLDPATDKQPRTLDSAPRRRALRGGTATGLLLGGCLPCVVQTLGTKYRPDYNGAVLLLETPEAEHRPDAGWGLAQARTALTDLRNAGVLHQIAGLVVGRPFMYDAETSERFEAAVMEACRDSRYPILGNIDAGHSHPILTLPLGVKVRVTARQEPDVASIAVMENPTSI